MLELINSELPAGRLGNDLLEVDIPKGALHWGSTEAFPDKHWDDLALRIGVDRILVEAKLALRVSSNISTARIVERGWDIENTFSAYEIVDVSLCLNDARQLIACLVSGFYPWSINIRTTEEAEWRVTRSGHPAQWVAWFLRQVARQCAFAPPAVERLLELIEGAFTARATGFTGPALLDVAMEMPEGVLRWGSTEAFPHDDWGGLILRIGTIGSRVNAVLPLKASSNTSEACRLPQPSEDAGHACEIVGGYLCLVDARQLLVALITRLRPRSMTVNTRQWARNAGAWWLHSGVRTIAGNPSFSTSADQTTTVSPAVHRTLELTGSLLKIHPDHQLLELAIPRDVLHWDGSEAFVGKDWGSLVVRIDADNNLVEATIPLRESSDISMSRLVETQRGSSEDPCSRYQIANVNLCLADARQLVVCLVAGFQPWSINIRTIE